MTSSPARARVLLLAIPVAAAWPASFAQAAAGGMPFLAHRAIYDLKLGKTSGSQAPVSARGRIVYEFSGTACDGYVTNFRQITEVQMEEGGPRVSDMRSATFEEGDGSAFRFKTDTYMDGKLVETVDGKATRPADGPLAVELTKPAPDKFQLGAGPIFPTAHMQFVIAAAMAGDRTSQTPIFDGSDSGKKVFDTMIVTGPPATGAPTEPVAAEAESLGNVRRWPVSVSYFDPQKQDSSPNYVIAFDLYENGVSGKLRIDYGSYTLVGELAKFETLPVKACDK